MGGARWRVVLDLSRLCAIRLAACDAWLAVVAMQDLSGDTGPGCSSGAVCDPVRSVTARVAWSCFSLICVSRGRELHCLHASLLSTCQHSACRLTSHPWSECGCRRGRLLWAGMGINGYAPAPRFSCPLVINGCARTRSFALPVSINAYARIRNT